MQRELLSNPEVQGCLAERALVRFYHDKTGGKITDFAGDRVRARMFLSRYDVFATPTLLFVDADGRPLADPLVGYNDAENYRDLLSRRLDQARSAMDATPGETAPGLASAAH
jgi:thioredoxin-related protein